MGRWLLLVACFVCAVACGGAGRWVKLQTEHFDLYTDLGDADAGRAAAALERTRAAILIAAWSKDVGSKRTSRAAVVVLGDGLAFEHYVGRSYTGVFGSVVRPTLV